jgi:hypothetical protein
MKRLLFTLVVAASATALAPSAASAAPVCTSVNKGGPTADRKLVVSACRDYAYDGHREYAVLYIGRSATAAHSCEVSLSTVEVGENGAPVHWTNGTTQRCEESLRVRNTSIRYWSPIVETPHRWYRAKTVACLLLNNRKVGSCVYSPELIYR